MSRFALLLLAGLLCLAVQPAAAAPGAVAALIAKGDVLAAAYQPGHGARPPHSAPHDTHDPHDPHDPHQYDRRQ